MASWLSSSADASAFGNWSGIGGVGTGGTATATTSVSNSGNIYSATGYFSGINGSSRAGAIGVGWHGYGGTASATTNIYNSGNITGDAGITGGARAYAGGYGSNAIEPGKGVGGTATAMVTITNVASGTIRATGDGIYGYSRAQAYGEGIFGGKGSFGPLT